VLGPDPHLHRAELAAEIGPLTIPPALAAAEQVAAD
jgi:hypothetical protein